MVNLPPEFFELPTPFSLVLATTLSRHLLVNIRIQASRQEKMETEFSLEAIQFQSGPGFGEGAHDRSLGSTHTMATTID